VKGKGKSGEKGEMGREPHQGCGRSAGEAHDEWNQPLLMKEEKEGRR